MSSRRESIWIIADILELARNGATITLLTRKLRLNFRVAQRHVERLLASGHLKKHLTVRGVLHELTEKGEQFLVRLKAIKWDVDDVFSPLRPSTFLAENRASPFHLKNGRRPFRVQLETPG